MSENQADNFVPTPPTESAPTAPAPSAPHPGSAPTSGMAIAALITSIIGIFVWALFPLLGLIFSILGMKDTKNGAKGGRGMAIAGLIMSILGLLAGLFWVLIFGIAMITADDIDDNYNYDYNSSSSSITSDTKVKSGSIGEAVTVENMELTVKEVKRNYVAESEYYTPDTGKEYVAVSVTINNKGSDSESFSSFDFKMRDSTGTEKSDSYVGGTTNELTSGSLAADGSTSGVMVFEVPSGDNNLVLIYEPSFFGSEKAEISL